MIRPNFNSFYRDVPEEQQKLFLDFLEDHPYSTIVFQNKEQKYITSGHGERTLVFLHGAFIRPDMWFYPILKLEHEFRIIAPLFPVQGMRANEAINYIRFILEKEKIKKAVLIGYSYGGGVAQYFAEKYPDMVDTLVLSHTGLLRKKKDYEKIRKTYKILKILPFFFLKIVLRKRIAHCPGSNWNEFHKAYFSEIASQLTKSLFLEKLQNDLKFLKEIEYIPINKREWHGKTILLGTRSDKDAFKYFDKFKNLYPNSKSFIFEEEGGHHMIFLFPEKYTAILTQYLE